nr:hypothetical protein [Candidatus Sigynarchaeota archaeon]
MSKNFGGNNLSIMRFAIPRKGKKYACIDVSQVWISYSSGYLFTRHVESTTFCTPG